MSAFNPEDLSATGVILGQLQIVKRFIPEKFLKLLPLVAIGLGILYVYTVKPGASHSVAASVTMGFALGISAVGLYEGTIHSVDFLKGLKAKDAKP